MAKGQLRGNKEAKKPKQPKKQPTPATGVSWNTAAKTVTPTAPVKKK